jgi:hypothetical protein
MGACGTACSSSAECSPEVNIPTQDVGKYAYHALKVLAIKNTLFGPLVAAHFGLIMHQSPFSVQYISVNLTKQGSEIYLDTRTPMSTMPEKSLIS